VKTSSISYLVITGDHLLMKSVLKSFGEKVTQAVPGEGKKPQPSSFQVGRKEYRVKQLLGEGNYAFVWLCKEEGGHGEDVAVKQIVADGSKNQRAAELELALMDAAKALNSPHLVHLVDSAKHALSAQTTEYLMVHSEGVTHLGLSSDCCC
jgi:serine/threonine protein kinase